MNTLPEGYREIRRIDLMNNRREAIAVNLLAVLVMLLLLPLGFVLAPPLAWEIRLPRLLPMLLTLMGIVAYLVVHELVHGVFMKAYSGVKPRYGFTGLYAYAGCDALFARRRYLVIAFAPVVLLGVLLAALNAALYETHFWHVYLVQIVNLSGAAGDLYVGRQIGKAPDDVLIHDSGTDMTLYSAKGTPSPRPRAAKRRAGTR